MLKMVRIIAGLSQIKIYYMDRKKFVALFSTSILGIALMKANPLNLFLPKKTAKSHKAVEVKINPNAVTEKKSGKKNG